MNRGKLANFIDGCSSAEDDRSVLNSTKISCLLALLFANLIRAESEPLDLAIFASPTFSNEAGLLEASLGDLEGIGLVERADLEKVVEERAIQLAGAAESAGFSLDAADALLVIEEGRSEAISVVVSRLISLVDGGVIDALVTPRASFKTTAWIDDVAGLVARHRDRLTGPTNAQHRVVIQAFQPAFAVGVSGRQAKRDLMKILMLGEAVGAELARGGFAVLEKDRIEEMLFDLGLTELIPPSLPTAAIELSAKIELRTGEESAILTINRGAGEITQLDPIRLAEESAWAGQIAMAFQEALGSAPLTGVQRSPEEEGRLLFEDAARLHLAEMHELAERRWAAGRQFGYRTPESDLLGLHLAMRKVRPRLDVWKMTSLQSVTPHRGGTSGLQMTLEGAQGAADACQLMREMAYYDDHDPKDLKNIYYGVRRSIALPFLNHASEIKAELSEELQEAIGEVRDDYQEMHDALFVNAVIRSHDYLRSTLSAPTAKEDIAMHEKSLERLAVIATDTGEPESSKQPTFDPPPPPDETAPLPIITAKPIPLGDRQGKHAEGHGLYYDHLLLQLEGPKCILIEASGVMGKSHRGDHQIILADLSNPASPVLTPIEKPKWISRFVSSQVYDLPFFHNNRLHYALGPFLLDHRADGSGWEVREKKLPLPPSLGYQNDLDTTFFPSQDAASPWAAMIGGRFQDEATVLVIDPETLEETILASSERHPAAHEWDRYNSLGGIVPTPDGGALVRYSKDGASFDEASLVKLAPDGLSGKVILPREVLGQFREIYAQAGDWVLTYSYDKIWRATVFAVSIHDQEVRLLLSPENFPIEVNGHSFAPLYPAPPAAEFSPVKGDWWEGMNFSKFHKYPLGKYRLAETRGLPVAYDGVTLVVTDVRPEDQRWIRPGHTGDLLRPLHIYRQEGAPPVSFSLRAEGALRPFTSDYEEFGFYSPEVGGWKASDPHLMEDGLLMHSWGELYYIPWTEISEVTGME